MKYYKANAVNGVLIAISEDCGYSVDYSCVLYSVKNKNARMFRKVAKIVDIKIEKVYSTVAMRFLGF